jgi:hypothetical protein
MYFAVDTDHNMYFEFAFCSQANNHQSLTCLPSRMSTSRDSMSNNLGPYGMLANFINDLFLFIFLEGAMNPSEATILSSFCYMYIECVVTFYFLLFRQQYFVTKVPFNTTTKEKEIIKYLQQCAMKS